MATQRAASAWLIALARIGLSNLGAASARLDRQAATVRYAFGVR